MKKISVSSLALFIILIGVSITAFDLWEDKKGLKNQVERLQTQKEELTNSIVDEYVDEVDTVPHVRFKDRIVTRKDLKDGEVPISKGLLDTLVQAVKTAENNELNYKKRLTEVTRINAKLEETVQGFKGDWDKGVLATFQTKYLNASVDTSYRLKYKYLAEIRVSGFSEPTGFLGMGQPEYYVDVYSPDSAMQIQSIDRFRVLEDQKKRKWGIGFIGGYVISSGNSGSKPITLSPAIGIGVSYDIGRW